LNNGYAPTLRTAAGEVLQVEDHGTPDALHHAAVAYLLTGDPEAAVERLERCAQRLPRDAAVWSDLSAALYVLAMKTDDPSELPRALAAADRALTLSPNLAEAHFNRSLVLERLFLLPWAAAGWAEYVRRDSSAWSAEAANHLNKLKSAHKHKDATQELKDAITAARRGDRPKLDAQVRDDPMFACAYGDAYLWIDLAKAFEARDQSAWTEAVDRAHLLSDALVPVTGDRMLADSIAAIRRAATPLRRQRLTKACRAYAAGRIAYNSAEYLAARDYFHDAALLGSGSPLQLLARYYEANVVADAGNVTESDAILRALEGQIDRLRGRRLFAEIEYQLGRNAAFRAEWSVSLQFLQKAQALLGSPQRVAFAEATIAEAYDRLGQTEQGWRHRLASLATLSKGGPRGARQAYVVLTGGVRAELMRDRPDAALALATVATEDPRKAPDRVLLTEALTLRAQVLSRTGDQARATEGIANARNAASDIGDCAAYEDAISHIDIVDALNRRASDPGKAVALLTAVLDFYRASGRAMSIPRLYLERGRAYSQMRNRSMALRDFFAAIGQVEAQRSTIDQDDLRLWFFDTERELFSEATSLLLDEGDYETAFGLVERSRARTLNEQLGVRQPMPSAALSVIQRSLRADEGLLLYELTPDGFAIFLVDARSVAVQRVRVARHDVRRLVASFEKAIARREPATVVLQRSAAVRRLLLLPVADWLRCYQRLIIIPDRFLFNVPFAALYDADTRKYLIETHVVTVAPGATGLSTRSRRGFASLQPALIIADPARPDSPSLPSSRAEADSIAALYDRATQLVGPDASVGAFVRLAAQARLIHYAGHARADQIAGNMLFSATAPGGDDVLTAANVAKLRLHRAPLVVLAACGTLRGKTEHIEGMPSLARAFLSAGARSVIGTLWDIPDEQSASFFRELHRRLKGDADAARALAETQRALLHRDGRLADPATWAAVEILGVN
jgi:CHAT domain-containing protein